jgi:hypothetical protein
MIRDYISRMYKAGQNTEARRAIRQEIIRENTPEDQEPTYEPGEAEIDTVESEYYAARRAYRYGTPIGQIEYITEHGITAWKARVKVIKDEIGKPVER